MNQNNRVKYPSPFPGGKHPNEVGRLNFHRGAIRAVKDGEEIRIELFAIGGWRAVDAALAKNLTLTRGYRVRIEQFIKKHAPALLE